MSSLKDEVLRALSRSLDEGRLERELASLRSSGSSSAPQVTSSASSRSAPASGEKSASEAGLFSRLLLTDILDDSILGARPGEPGFPFRIFLSKLGQALDDPGDDVGLALASGLSFYFRSEMDEESKMRVGVAISQLYYRFSEREGFETRQVRELSPLLAQVLSAELEQLVFESVDHDRLFDSAIHERARGADRSGAHLRSPKSFLCRVVASGAVRIKAQVVT